MPSQAVMVLLRGTYTLKSPFKSPPPTCVWAQIEWGWLWCWTETAPEKSHHIQCSFSEKNSKNKAPQDPGGTKTIRGTCPWCSGSQGMTSLPLMDAAVAFRCDTDNPQRRNPLAQKVTGKGISKCDSENRSALYFSSSLRRDKNGFYSFYDFHSLPEWYWSLFDDFWLLLWIYTNMAILKMCTKMAKIYGIPSSIKNFCFLKRKIHSLSQCIQTGSIGKYPFMPWCETFQKQKGNKLKISWIHLEPGTVVGALTGMNLFHQFPNFYNGL